MRGASRARAGPGAGDAGAHKGTPLRSGTLGRGAGDAPTRITHASPDRPLVGSVLARNSQP